MANPEWDNYKTIERIKLSGAQATRVREALQRFDDNTERYETYAQPPLRIVLEDLVNDILEVIR